MLALLRLIRIQNIIIIFITQVITYYALVIESIKFEVNVKLFLLSIGTILIASAGNIINDYFDVDIDRINKPGWNIIDEKINKRNALIIYLIFNVLAFLIGLYLSRAVLIIYLLSFMTLFVYSWKLKRTVLIGNIIISLLFALTLFLVWFYFKKGDLLLIAFYSLFAFIIGLSREIIKDIEDIEGDLSKRLKTFPIIYGIDKSKWLVVVLILTLIASVGVFVIRGPILMFIFIKLYLLAFVVLPIVILIVMIKDAKLKYDYTRISYRLKLIMVIGILSMLLKFF